MSPSKRVSIHRRWQDELDVSHKPLYFKRLRTKLNLASKLIDQFKYSLFLENKLVLFDNITYQIIMLMYKT